MSVLSWLKPATLAVTLVAAGSLLAPAPVQAQVTVLRGSPSQPLQPSVQDNTRDNQSSNYSASGYDDYPYYGDDFPWGVGGVGRGFHRGGFRSGDFFHRGFHAGFHGGGFHGRAFHGGGFHGGGFHGGGFHGGGGHR
jgi:hypothetical protein